jgi:hypothetical protein
MPARAPLADSIIRAKTAAPQYGTWFSYDGTARIWLAVILLIVAGGLAYWGTRLRHPIAVARPGRRAAVVMLVTWALAIVTFLVAVFFYAQRESLDHLLKPPPANPVTVVTLTAVVVTFVIIWVTGQPRDSRTVLAGAIIGALAAPMIFELPFDLIIMARTYPPLPPDPALYRAIFFVPLFLIEISTLALLTLSPLVRLSRPAFIFLALMFVVFAVWGLLGFAYPSAPSDIALNMLSKILAFVVALCLFLPPRAPVRADRPAG